MWSLVRTIAVLLLAAWLAGCASRTTVVLLPEANGRSTAVSVTRDGQPTVLLDEPYEAVRESAFGMRTFKTEVGYNNVEYRNVTGRAWVMPLKLTGKNQPGPRDPNLCSDPVCCPPPEPVAGAPALAPTFDTMTPDAFIVFNGYGDLSGYGPARIMAHMAGMTYRKVAFTCSPMYVNGEQGYLVAPEALAEKYTDGRLNLSVPQHADLYDTEINESKELVNA